ncbi:MAG: hypothetical protein DHS20C16_14890 [Phycisphaerae bacterium]|nr:MAG: hypothetical protein DHS20C16_14890 [Phycisphaerae bacterium]
MWAQAAALQDAGEYLRAAIAFRGVLEEFPRSQRAALRIGICEERGGLDGNAVDSYQAAIDLSPYGAWSPKSLFHQARLCREYGCGPTARDAIQVLLQRFPESAWAVRARIVGAQLDGLDSDNAQAEFDAELLSAQELDDIRGLSGNISDAEQLSRLADLVSGESDTGTSLRARKRIGHILIRLGRTEEAIGAFEDLLEQLQEAAPESRLVQETRTRLAALYHATGQLQDAQLEFDELAATATNPSVRRNAMLQGAGLTMEQVIERIENGASASDESWQNVRTRCEAIRSQPGATKKQIARADLMIMESLHWQQRPTQALAAARRFLTELGELPFAVSTTDSVSPSTSGSELAVDSELPTLASEIAMAHLVAGECLQRRRQHDAALLHFRRIIELFGDEEIMPGLTNTQRTHFRIFDALRRGGGSEEEVYVAAEYVLSRWPDSSYADLVRIHGFGD